VAYQNSTVPIELGIIANIRSGRPASPINIPMIGTHAPTVMMCSITGGRGVPCVYPHASMGARSNNASHTVPLTSGAESPIKLARDLQSVRLGIRKYLSQPQAKMNGDVRPIALIIVHSIAVLFLRFTTRVSGTRVTRTAHGKGISPAKTAFSSTGELLEIRRSLAVFESCSDK